MGQDFREPILVQVVLRKSSYKALGYDPETVIQRQALAYINDASGVVDAQTKGLEE